MATHVFNEFKRAQQAGEVNLAGDIRVSLHMTGSSIATQNDGIVTNANFTTPAEFDGPDYIAGGAALSGEVVNKDDANDRSEFDATDLNLGAQNAGSAALIGVLVYKFVTNWGASLPICWLEPATWPLTPNGGTITLQWNIEGILQNA